MSEYWVSNKKFFCTYCRIYLQDNKISRQTHETGKKHKDNVAAYLRDVHTRTEEKGKANAETAAMMAIINQAASKQFARDQRAKLEPHATKHEPNIDDYGSGTRRSDQGGGGPSASDREAGKILDLLAKQREDKAEALRAKAAAEAAADGEGEGGGPESDPHPYGEWSTLETASSLRGADAAGGEKRPRESGKTSNQPSWADDGDEEPEDNVKRFKVTEKVLPTEGTFGESDEAPAPVFKKRKAPRSSARRRDD
ncbi:hypothetical protein HDU87_003602 [Geranomyces variabilis]|uniref:Matrin-type domain-containing protein n=1 Tax=Geranomyces variabilis TaxID=109894 RepID=A0AAD5TJA4_9FUNG|nr:hypothetical protein HDU87_003602 [Geranomyces variabilis]